MLFCRNHVFFQHLDEDDEDMNVLEEGGDDEEERNIKL